MQTAAAVHSLLFFFVASQWMNPHIYILSSAQAEKLDFDIFTRICWTSQPPTEMIIKLRSRSHQLYSVVVVVRSSAALLLSHEEFLMSLMGGRETRSWAELDSSWLFHHLNFTLVSCVEQRSSGGKKFKFPFISISSSLLCLSLLRLVPETVSSSLHMAVMGRAGGDSSQLSRVNIK